jgi:hypothetical protein
VRGARSTPWFRELNAETPRNRIMQLPLSHRVIAAPSCTLASEWDNEAFWGA